MNIETFQPRGSTVLVRRVKLTKEDTGGIIVPGNEYGNYAFAEVIAKGPGNATVSHVGDINDQYTGADTRYMGETADLSIGDLVIMKTGMSENRMTGQQRVDMSLPFAVAGEKVELIGEGMIVAIITKSKENA